MVPKQEITNTIPGINNRWIVITSNSRVHLWLYHFRAIKLRFLHLSCIHPHICDSGSSSTFAEPPPEFPP